MASRNSLDSPVIQRAGVNEAIRRDLMNALLALSFRGFEECVRLVLTKAGYSNVQIVRSAHRGRKAAGGFDGVAGAEAGLSNTSVLIQLKQTRRPIQRRFVDELRGTMTRTKAQQGIIVTTSSFPNGARIAAQAEKMTPVLLIDGEQLVSMHLSHQVGAELNDKNVWSIDRRFFSRIEQYYPKKKPSSGLSQKRPHTCSCIHTASGYLNCQTKGDEMRGTTHLFAGISSLWLWVLLSQGTVQESLPFLVVCASLGSLLPDLDAQNSTIKQLKIIGVRPFAIPSAVINKSFGHRGLLHSAVGLCLIVGIVSPLSVFIGWKAIAAVGLGYASHLVTDAMTPSGIPVFFPKTRRFHILPKRLRITTGSLAEDLLFPLFTTSVFLLFLYIGAGLIQRPGFA
jgi:inner membrane protein